jgi:hypothetical protein
MNVMRLIIPRILLSQFAGMAVITALGAISGGIYGVIHDQVNHSISEEYFTRFKFIQFAYARPPDSSPRVFVGVIGFLAAWWVGALVGWILARVCIAREGGLPPARDLVIAFALVLLTSMAAAREKCRIRLGVSRWKE